MRRCNAPYHQWVPSTRNIVSNSFGCIFSAEDRRGLAFSCRVPDDELRRAGLIKVEPAEIFADQPENHELNAGKKHDAAQDRGDTNGEIWSDPKLVDQNGNQGDDAQTGSKQTDINRDAKRLD